MRAVVEPGSSAVHAQSGTNYLRTSGFIWMGSPIPGATLTVGEASVCLSVSLGYFNSKSADTCVQVFEEFAPWECLVGGVRPRTRPWTSRRPSAGQPGHCAQQVLVSGMGVDRRGQDRLMMGEGRRSYTPNRNSELLSASRTCSIRLAARLSLRPSPSQCA